jgi:hypothetical protein
MTTKTISFISCLCISSLLFAQPYLNLAKVSYSYTPRSREKTNSIRSDLYSLNITIPIELKKDGDAFIVNPFFDHNKGNVSTRRFGVISQGNLLGFLKKDIFKNWSLLSSFILRRNKQESEKVDDPWQYGEVILATWKRNRFASLKFGVYYNKEFFGNYFMPLVGIDWKINENNNLFGVLPGNMAFEHKVTKNFYYGFLFTALTNSYRLQTIDPCFSGDCSARNYLRVDDNQLGAFADIYLAKKIVFTAEAGCTILRKYRFGLKGQNIHLRTDYKNDNFYLRTSLAYRLRFR